MGSDTINWKDIPDLMSKETLFRICHISKSTARYLLMNGLITCEYTGKKTRCFRIRKEDVKRYLKEREKYPERYALPHKSCNPGEAAKAKVGLFPVIYEDMHEFYSYLLNSEKDVLTASEVSSIIGYSQKAIDSWCSKGQIKYFMKQHTIHIPKVFLIDYLCNPKSMRTRSRSAWHNNAMQSFDKWKSEHNSRP